MILYAITVTDSLSYTPMGNAAAENDSLRYYDYRLHKTHGARKTRAAHGAIACVLRVRHGLTSSLKYATYACRVRVITYACRVRLLRTVRAVRAHAVRPPGRTRYVRAK